MEPLQKNKNGMPSESCTENAALEQCNVSDNLEQIVDGLSNIIGSADEQNTFIKAKEHYSEL